MMAGLIVLFVNIICPDGETGCSVFAQQLILNKLKHGQLTWISKGLKYLKSTLDSFSLYLSGRKIGGRIMLLF